MLKEWKVRVCSQLGDFSVGKGGSPGKGETGSRSDGCESMASSPEQAPPGRRVQWGTVAELMKQLQSSLGLTKSWCSQVRGWWEGWDQFSCPWKFKQEGMAREVELPLSGLQEPSSVAGPDLHLPDVHLPTFRGDNTRGKKQGRRKHPPSHNS